MADEERLVAFLERCNFKSQLLTFFSTENPKDAQLRKLILGMNVRKGDDAGNPITLSAILRGFLLIKTRPPHSIATGIMQDLAQVHERVRHGMESCSDGDLVPTPAKRPNAPFETPDCAQIFLLGLQLRFLRRQLAVMTG